MINDIREISDKWIGPYCCGESLTMGDIVLAPYFARMGVLEYYRKFTVPDKIVNWH